MYVGISKVSDNLFFIAINKGIALLQIVGFSCNRSIMFQVLCLFFIDFDQLQPRVSLCVDCNPLVDHRPISAGVSSWALLPAPGNASFHIEAILEGEGAGSALLPSLFKVMLDWQSMLLISVGFRMTCRSI